MKKCKINHTYWLPCLVTTQSILLGLIDLCLMKSVLSLFLLYWGTVLKWLTQGYKVNGWIGIQAPTGRSQSHSLNCHVIMARTLFTYQTGKIKTHNPALLMMWRNMQSYLVLVEVNILKSSLAPKISVLSVHILQLNHSISWNLS